MDELAEELYGMAPGEFVAARDERVRQAREAGDRELAARLAKLRRPTVSAWLVNMLSRERGAAVDELLALAAEYRSEELTGQRLRELSVRRRELLRRLVAEAERLGAAAGVRLSAQVERDIEATFAAAIADSEAASQVRSGRLERPLAYAGFGPELQLVPGPADAAAPAASREPTEPAAPAAAEPAEPAGRPVAKADHDAEPGATQEREAMAAARRAVDERAEAVEAAERRRAELTERRAALRTELDRVRAELSGVEAQLTTAERAVVAESVRLRQAQRELDRQARR